MHRAKVLCARVGLIGVELPACQGCNGGGPIETYFWNQNAGTGAWTTGADWTNATTGQTGSVPSAADSVFITQPGSFTIIFDSKATLEVYADTLGVAAANGTIDLQSGRTLAVSGLGSLSAGTLLDSGLFTTGGLMQTGGAIVSNGTIGASAAVSISGGSLQETGGAFNVTAGGLLVGGAATSVMLNGGTAGITGGVTLEGGSLSIANTLVADTFIVSSGSLTVSDTVSSGDFMMSGGSLAVQAGADITVTGTSTFTGGSATISGGLFYDTGGGLNFGTAGSLSVTGGELALAGATTLTAAASVSSGLFYVTSGGMLLGSGGSLAVSGGEATVTGQTTLAAATAMLTGGTFFVASGGLTVAGGGTLASSGAFTQIDGGTTLTAGTALVTAGTFFVHDTGLSVSSAGSLVAGGGNATVEGGLTLAGTASVSGGTLYVATGGASLSHGGNLAVTAGDATIADGIDLSAGHASIAGGLLYVMSGGLTVGSSGTFAATGGQTTILGSLASTGAMALSGTGTLSTNTLSVTAGTFADASASFVVGGLASFSGGLDTFTGGVFGAGTLSVSNTVSLAGGGLAIGGGGIVDTGTLTGYGTLQGAISGSGSVIARGGTLQLNTGLVSASTSFTIASSPGAVLRLNNAVAAGVAIGFAGTQGVLELHDLTNSGGVDSLNFSGTVSGVNVGTSASAPTNAINVQGAAVTGAVLSGSTLEILDATGTIASIALARTSGAALATAYANWQSDPTLGGTDIFLSDVVCFAAGTRIRTPDGAVAVESLAEGDMVVTLERGAPVPQQVTWIGRRRLDLRLHPRPELAAPVRIRRGAIAPGLPHRDLLVSPDHCLFLHERLIPAKLLINGMTIVQERQMPSVQYFHVELERHAILLAEGLAAESYLDTGNRAFFANAGLAVMLHPEFAVNASLKQWATDAAAPLAVAQAVVAPVWQDLAWRAAKLGYRPPRFQTVADPDLQLLVDGRTLRPVVHDARRAVFAVPAGVEAAWLLSRWDIPADHVPALDDFRRLGVRVERIRLRGGHGVTDIAPDDPVLRRGWHPPEYYGAAIWRWTNGNALVPLGGGGPMTLELWLGGGMEYRLPAAAAPDGAVRRAA